MARYREMATLPAGYILQCKVSSNMHMTVNLNSVFGFRRLEFFIYSKSYVDHGVQYCTIIRSRSIMHSVSSVTNNTIVPSKIFRPSAVPEDENWLVMLLRPRLTRSLAFM